MNFRKERRTIAFYVLCAILIVFFIFPVFWQILASLKSYGQLITLEWPTVFIFEPTLENYAATYYDALPTIRNSLILAGTSTILCLAAGSFAGYGFARFKWRGKEDLAFLILTIRLLPPIVSLIPYYVILVNLKLIDTYPPLILLYTYMDLAFVIWLMRGVFEEIPPDFEESAMIDGCSRLTALRRIVMPLALPGLVVAGVFSFVFAWNEYLLALALTALDVKTMPVHMSGFIQRVTRIKWEQVAAVSSLYIFPAIIIAIAFRKYIVRGLTFGMVRPKGE
mgnify:CR=1 FL=1